MHGSNLDNGTAGYEHHDKPPKLDTTKSPYFPGQLRIEVDRYGVALYRAKFYPEHGKVKLKPVQRLSDRDMRQLGAGVVGDWLVRFGAKLDS